MSKIAFKSSTFNRGTISPRLLGNTQSEVYTSSLYASMNFIIGTYGFATSRPGTEFIRSVKTPAKKSVLIPLSYPNQPSYMLEFAENTIRFFKDKGILGAPYEVTTTYAEVDLEKIQAVRVFDTIYLTCDGYPVKKLQRINDTNWTFGDVDFIEPAWLDENDTTTTLTFSAVTGTGVTCTASAATFVSTDVGRHIRFKSGPTDEDGLLYVSPGSSQVFFNIGFFPKTSTAVEVFRIETTGARTELTYNAGVLTADQFKITSGQVEIYAALTAGQTLLVQRKYSGSGKWGYVVITGYTSSTVVTVTVVNELGGTNPSDMWKLGAWSVTTGYPKKVNFFKQRLWFANTDKQPNGIWASGIQDFENFSQDDIFQLGTPIAESSISAEIDNIGAINWLGISGNVLILGGDGIRSIGAGGAPILGNDILSVRPEETIVVKDIKPISNMNEVVFADNAGKFIYSAEFSFQSGGYITTKLNSLNDMLFETSQVKKIEFTQNPFPIVWILKNDGTLVAMTYDKNLKVIAPMEQIIAGEDCIVEDIASIPNGDKTELWMTVKRTINGGTVRYIEVLDQYFYGDEAKTARFFDSSLVYDGVSATTITGLGHLEGETVSTIGDGSVQTDKVVTSGEITLDTAVEYAIIGLKGVRYIQGNPINAGRRDGVGVGNIMRIREIGVDLFESLSAKLTMVGNNGVDINFRPAYLIGGESNELFSGFKYEFVEHTPDRYNMWKIEEIYGLPCTIRAVMSKLEVTDN